MVYTEYTSEIFGYCQELEFPLYYLLQPYLLLAVNLVFFTLTCVTNPGTITKANESALLQVYEFDDVMFPKNARCSACDLRKPARSKHCRVCDCCVHRFDHHCVWVNNCIGAWNARYFLIYLATLAASAASVAAVSTTFLIHLVALSDLHQETYVDDRGHLQAVGVFFLVQASCVDSPCFWWLMNMWVFPLSGCLRRMLRTFTCKSLFLAFPKIVLLLGFVVVLSILLGGYLCFVLYLAVTNQTTFEWFRWDWARRQRCPLVAQPRVYRNIHRHGLGSNLREIFLPVVPDCEGKKK
nr:palmitoyltransferase ZDHHC4 [Oryctolagus cuniculus]